MKNKALAGITQREKLSVQMIEEGDFGTGMLTKNVSSVE